MTVGNKKGGELEKCNYLFENTKYSDASIGNWGYWLENPCSNTSSYAWIVFGSSRLVGSDFDTNNNELFGVRPVIEVPKSNMSY